MNKSANLQNVLKEVYSLGARPVGELLHIDLSRLQVYTRYPEEYTIEDHGKFDMQQFQAGPDELYNLVITESDFAADRRLYEMMRDVELRNVKDYKLIDQNKPREGYFLYKLMPYTVQGKPTWY